MSFIALSEASRASERDARFRERLTTDAVLFVRANKTDEDRLAVQIVQSELQGNVKIIESDVDPYDVRPRLEAGRGSVYRGVAAIRGLFETLRNLAPLS